MLFSTRMSALSFTVAALLAGGLACNRRDSSATRTATAADDKALAESAAVYEKQATMFRKVGETRNLQGPESARYDKDLDVWFVSNVNGQPGTKDNNGYISRLRPDGTPYNLKFIEGGKNGVTLNAPKGLAISGDTLWVADIDAARAFNKRTGAVIANVNIRGRSKFLNGATVGPDGIYMTDTGIIFGSKGDVSHPGPDQVFRIQANGDAVAVLTTPKLEGPNGIIWDSREKRFVIVSYLGKGIYSWKPGDKDIQSLGTGPGQHDGVLVLPDGRILATSWADSSLFVLDKGKVSKVATGVASPADIDIDTKDSRVAVPQLMGNAVQFWEVP
jgi:sugar lactone lactonase YvrE